MKPKEYFLDPKGTWIRIADWLEGWAIEGHLHVIEKSAYDEKCREFDDYRIKRASCCNDLEEKLAIAVEALGKCQTAVPCDHEYSGECSACIVDEIAGDALAKINKEQDK